MKCGIRSLIVLLMTSSLNRAADWPGWLGPERNGTTTESVQTWKKSVPVLWRRNVGEGHSSPVVVGSRVFYHARVKDRDEEEVVCLEAITGKPVWHAAYQRAHFVSLFGNGPRATPVVADGRLFTFGVTGILSAFDAENGRVLWRIDTLKKFGAANLGFGVSSSPLVDGNRVVVNVGGPGASVVAFAAESGKVIWQSLDDRASYSSPVIFSREGGRQLIFFTQQGLVGINPRSGKALWRFPLIDALSESSVTPVIASDLIVAGTITKGSVGLRHSREANKNEPEQVWKNADLTCYFSTPVVVDKALFMVTGSLSPLFPEATLRCIDVNSGKELWQKPKVGKYHGSLLRTGNGRLLLLEEAGDLVLIDPQREAYRELARTKVSGESWAFPALSNGRLYLRDRNELICLKIGD